MKYLSLVLLLIWMAFIFTFSSENGEYSKNRSIEAASTSINTIKNITRKDADDDIISSKKQSIIHNVQPVVKDCSKNSKIVSNLFLIRKSAHIFEYFVLGILMLNVLRYYCKPSFKLVILSAMLCILYACTDEIHQLFVPARTGKIIDVFIDSIGIILGSCFFYLVLKIRLKKNRLDVI